VLGMGQIVLLDGGELPRALFAGSGGSARRRGVERSAAARSE
jgi:hypothetical protein